MCSYGLCQRVYLVFLRLIESKALEVLPISHVLHAPKARAVDKVCPRRRCALTRVAVLTLHPRCRNRPLRFVRQRSTRGGAFADVAIGRNHALRVRVAHLVAVVVRRRGVPLTAITSQRRSNAALVLYQRAAK